MLNAAVGLTEVEEKALKSLLAFTHRGELSFPLDIQELTRVGLQHCAANLLGVLRDLDEPGVRAVLVAVLAERMPANRLRRVGAGLTGEA